MSTQRAKEIDYRRWIQRVANQLLNRIERAEIRDSDQLEVAVMVAAEQAVGSRQGGRQLVYTAHPEAEVLELEDLFADDVTNYMDATARNQRGWDGFDSENDRTWPVLRARGLWRAR